MGRRINTTGFQTTGGGGAVDGYFDRVVKYIPADIVAAWTAAIGLIGGQNALPGAATQTAASNITTLWVAFAVAVVLTALWTWRQTSHPNLPTAIRQIIVATLSFVVWAFAMGGPFATLGFYSPTIGSLVLIGWTLALGIIPPDPNTPSPPSPAPNP